MLFLLQGNAGEAGPAGNGGPKVGHSLNDLQS